MWRFQAKRRKCWLSARSGRGYRRAFSPALGSVIAAWGFGTENAHVPEEAELASALAAADYRTVTLDGNTVNTGGAMIDLGAAVKGYAA